MEPLIISFIVKEKSYKAEVVLIESSNTKLLQISKIRPVVDNAEVIFTYVVDEKRLISPVNSTTDLDFQKAMTDAMLKTCNDERSDWLT